MLFFVTVDDSNQSRAYYPKTETEPKNRDQNRTKNYKNPNGSYIYKSEHWNRTETKSRTKHVLEYFEYIKNINYFKF